MNYSVVSVRWTLMGGVVFLYFCVLLKNVLVVFTNTSASFSELEFTFLITLLLGQWIDGFVAGFFGMGEVAGFWSGCQDWSRSSGWLWHWPPSMKWYSLLWTAMPP